VATLVLGTASSALAAEDGIWSVRKASGDVWIATDGAQQVSLKQEETLKAGDTIRTGRNGRVLLVRGEETILISPNSVVGVPSEKKEGLSTTIVQQAGSILLEVEKRNVKHFEVETPYLAAVVKGTQFSVTVNGESTKVGVLRGQVEVSDFKTGQIAQVMPGQTAMAFEHGKPGLSLSGSGTFNPIEQGKPRASTIERIPVPKSGLPAPRNAANGHAFHALGHVEKSIKSAGASSRPGVVHISGVLGDVKLNFHKVTHGLAHGSAATGARSASNSSTDTIWGDSKSGSTTTAANSASQTAVTLSSSVANSSASSSGGSTTVATTAGSSSDAGNDNSGNGNGNSGNGNGNNGNNGATGNGKGNNGNGNGNGGGNGSNGNAYGHTKH
jgi:hypothetical protein